MNSRRTSTPSLAGCAAGSPDDIAWRQHDMVLRFAPDGALIFVNPACCAFFGKSAFELLETCLPDLAVPEDRARVLKVLRSLSAGKPPKPAVYRCKRADGVVRWVQWLSVAFEDAGDAGLVCQTVGRDVTSHKRIEQRLRESESRYRAIIEDQTDLIRRFRPDGTLTFVNHAFCRFYQKTRSELLGRKFQDLLPDDERQHIMQTIFSLTPRSPNCITEPRYFRPNGDVSWVQYATRAIFDANGRVVEYQSVGRDITAQKVAEARIQDAREAMDQAAKVTTLAVIGGGIAHEINQPLNALKVLAGTLAYLAKAAGDQIPGIIVENLRNLSGQVDRIDSIVNHLRHFLADSQTFDFTPCDINEIVDLTLAMLSNQLFSRHIQVTRQLEPGLPTVRGSSVRFEEVVLNLVMNAAEALDQVPKTGKITVRTWSEAETVNLCVSDNGPGISQESLEHLFDPFFTTKARGANMGIGLSIVQAIVVASSGKVTVQNLPEGGACVHVRLPAAKPPGL